MADPCNHLDHDPGNRADSWRVPGRATRAVVDLDAIAGNLRQFRSAVSGSAQLMAVVKANAYGHGAVMTARAALRAGADHLAVATVDEGLALRHAQINAPVLVLGPIDPSEAARAVRGGLTVAVGDAETVHALAAAAPASPSGLASVHLKVDTGMRRFGATPTDAVGLARFIASLPALRLAGTFTHFARADETDETPTLQQASLFDETVNAIRRTGVDPGLIHVANSAAALRSRRYDYDLVRIGIALYGLPPSAEVGLWPGMRPALSLRSRIRRIIHLEPGDCVSYGGTYRAAQAETAALVPIGYADGYHRVLSNRAWMGVAGQPAPVRGRVCMDQTVIGLPPGIDTALGAEVIVVGDRAQGAPTLPELAELAGTICYELATALPARVPRLYRQGGTIVAIEDSEGIRPVAERS